MKQTLVVFPGAWGNQTQDDVYWWFEHLQPLFRHFRVVLLTYEGRTLEQIGQNVLVQLRRQNVPALSLAICYSMGSQVLRQVQKIDPNRFSRAVLVSGIERTGIDNISFLKITMAAPWSFLASLLTGRVMLRSAHDCHRLMESGSTDRFEAAVGIHAHLQTEPMWWKIAQVFLPGFRTRLPALTIPVCAVVPANDLIAGRATYRDESVRIVHVAGSHGFIRHPMMGTPRLIDHLCFFLSAT